jgi:pimeloyl-ACP methyl ester carboxylesterase
MRALALLVVLASALPAAAQWKTVEPVKIKGAYGVIIIPENWNGGLFIYAHGYSADERLLVPFPQDVTPGNFTTTLPLLFQASVLPALVGKYAVATTTFRSVGWYIGDAVKDVENLRRYFVKKHGKPKFTYIWGHSAGGMVTQAVIEYFPRTYDGAMPMCGVGAGARRNFDGAFDLRVLYEYLCHGVPAAQFGCRVCSDGKSRCLIDADCPAGGTCGALEAPAPLADGLTAECTDFLLSHPEKFSESPTSPGGDFVSPPVTACFGDLSDGGAPPTPEQAARRSEFVRASQLPESFIVTDMFFATIGMGEVVHRRTGGKHPWGNEGVTYASPSTTPEEQAAFNAAVYRAKEDASAVRFMRRTYEPRGRTASKVITIHALDDGLVIPENEDKYREAFEAAGTSDDLVQLFTSTGGHCGFITELFPAIPALTGWVEGGTKPSTATVRAACPPGCTFTDDRPGPFGTKVIERRQKGAPVRTLVCAGETGDCPADATCDLHRRHCK